MAKNKSCNTTHKLWPKCIQCGEFLFIPKAFDKNELEELIDKKISQIDFHDFINEYEEDISYAVSKVVREYLILAFKQTKVKV